MDRPETRTSFVHRAHVLAAFAALVLVAGCQQRRTPYSSGNLVIDDGTDAVLGVYPRAPGG